MGPGTPIAADWKTQLIDKETWCTHGYCMKWTMNEVQNYTMHGVLGKQDPDPVNYFACNR